MLQSLLEYAKDSISTRCLESNLNEFFVIYKTCGGQSIQCLSLSKDVWYIRTTHLWKGTRRSSGKERLVGLCGKCEPGTWN